MGEIDYKARRLGIESYIVNMSTMKTNPTSLHFEVGNTFYKEDAPDLVFKVVKIEENKYFGIKFYYAIEA